jgi:hypothetical protein
MLEVMAQRVGVAGGGGTGKLLGKASVFGYIMGERAGKLSHLPSATREVGGTGVPRSLRPTFSGVPNRGKDQEGGQGFHSLGPRRERGEAGGETIYGATERRSGL